MLVRGELNVSDADALKDSEPFVEMGDWILVTGGGGFIGKHVVEKLLQRGFSRIRCLVRSSSGVEKLKSAFLPYQGKATIEVITGNLLSMEDCNQAAKDVRLVYHLAAGRGEKSFADAFMNSVVTTRNLLEACRRSKSLKRFVNISSFAVYANRDKGRRQVLDEQNAVEPQPASRGDAYVFAKLKQEELVVEYGQRWGLPYTIVRPGVVYGPGNEKITGRVGIGTFGVFLHLGGSNPIPFTYVENCAEAIVLAGITSGVNGEIFNVVDDGVPSSRQYLRLHKRNVGSFFSLYLPKTVSYCLCYLWEKYSAWSEGQLPPVYCTRAWYAFWKRTRYSNQKIKERLNWVQTVPTKLALERYFEAYRSKNSHA